MANEQNKSTCDPDQYKALFLEHGKALRNFLYYKTGDLEMARDIAQDAFLKLWNNCAKVPPEKAKSYLFTVANNQITDNARHRKVVLRYMEQAPKKNEQESPQYLMEEKEFKETLQKAIADLPEKQRTVFLMNRIEKMTYREIAEQLGLSVKAVEKRMHKALKALKNVSKKI